VDGDRSSSSGDHTHRQSSAVIGAVDAGGLLTNRNPTAASADHDSAHLRLT
jgi:hypothetical protein